MSVNRFLQASLLLCLLSVFMLPYIRASEGDQHHTVQECFLLLGGAATSSDGSVLVAHNNELSGENASLVEIIEAQKHKKDELITFTNGLQIPQVPYTYRMVVLRAERGFLEGDAVAMNQFQVAIAGGVALGKDRNDKARATDPLIPQGLPGGIRYIVLQRAQTAKQAVTLLGAMYSTYGISYPSGVGIADANEVWYIESGGGKSWAAVKIPPDHLWVQANAYGIGFVDCEDSERFLCSPNLMAFARKSGLWNPDQGQFHFAHAFGGAKRLLKSHRYYDNRRVWRAMKLLDQQRAISPDQDGFPGLIKPQKKLNVEDYIGILRDYFHGTRYDPFLHKGNKERPIAVPNTIHTSVVQLRQWLPSDIGAVLWAGVGSPLVTTYIPVHFGVTTIHPKYAFTEKTPNEKSAFWMFRKLMNITYPYYNFLGPQIVPEWGKQEKQLLKKTAIMEANAHSVFPVSELQASRIMTTFHQEAAEHALNSLQNVCRSVHLTIAKDYQCWQCENN